MKKMAFCRHFLSASVFMCGSFHAADMCDDGPDRPAHCNDLELSFVAASPLT
jgi:hypothetical protein